MFLIASDSSATNIGLEAMKTYQIVELRIGLY